MPWQNSQSPSSPWTKVNHSKGSVNYICDKVSRLLSVRSTVADFIAGYVPYEKERIKDFASVLFNAASYSQDGLAALDYSIFESKTANRGCTNRGSRSAILGGDYFFRACGSEEKNTLFTEVSEVTGIAVAWLP